MLKLGWHNWLKPIPQPSPALDLELRKQFRVDSWSDDPDYLGHLGHFFGGSSRSHRKLNYLDVNWTFNRSHVPWKKTLASDKRVNLGPGECIEPSLVWNLLTTLSCLKHVVSRDFIPKNSVHGTSFVSWRNLWHCFISDFSMLFYITF